MFVSMITLEIAALSLTAVKKMTVPFADGSGTAVASRGIEVGCV